MSPEEIQSLVNAWVKAKLDTDANVRSIGDPAAVEGHYEHHKELLGGSLLRISENDPRDARPVVEELARALNRVARAGAFRDLKSIIVLALPHARLKPKYNPNPLQTFFGQGKHSPARGEAARIRVYFNRFREMCPWRFQTLHYGVPGGYTSPLWRDTDELGNEVLQPFNYIPRGSR